MIYLASPYSHESPAVEEERFHAVCARAAEMMRAGVHVFSPIAHAHPISHYGLPGDWSYWEAYDRAMLTRCDALTVLRLPGWERSTGVQAEIQIARELGIPVDFVDPIYPKQERRTHDTCC